MILRKVIIDGKDKYEPINYKEALEYPNKDELVFTSDDEKEDFEESLEAQEAKVELEVRAEELYSRIDEMMCWFDNIEDHNKLSLKDRLEEIKNELDGYQDLSNDELEDKLDMVDDELDEIEDEFNDSHFYTHGQFQDDSNVKIAVNGKNVKLDKDFGDVFGKAFGSMFDKKKKSKVDELIAALPFMDKEDTHELVNAILNGSEQYKCLNLVQIMPFLSVSDCDALFMKFIMDDSKYTSSLVAVAPFASADCLSKVVDEYINGNYQNIEMSTLYPFLNSKDVKKVFDYILSKKNSNQEQ